MYPFIRMAKELFVNKSAQNLSVGEIHESFHICWPWDLDFWFELNNGRALTLYDFCLLYTSPSPRDATLSRKPSSA